MKASIPIKKAVKGKQLSEDGILNLAREMHEAYLREINSKKELLRSQMLELIELLSSQKGAGAKGKISSPKALEILVNNPNFFQMPETQKMFGTIAGGLLSNPESLKYLDKKNIPEELRLVLFGAAKSKSAEVSLGNSKLMIQPLLLILKSSGKGEDQLSPWQKEMSRIAMSKIVEDLEKNGFDVNKKFPSGNGGNTSLLNYAIAVNNLEGVKIFSAKAKDSDLDDDCAHALSLADDEVFEFLRTEKKFDKVIGSEKFAMRKAQMKIEERFLCALGSESPHTKKIIPMTAEEKIKSIQVYLGQDAKNVNRELRFANDQLRTPLTLAITNKCDGEIIEFLLKNGANIHQECLDLKYKLNLSPLFYAMQGNDPIYVQLFLDEGLLEIDEQVFFAKDSMTFLAFAAQVNNVDMVRYFLTKGANPDASITINQKEITPIRSVIAEYAANAFKNEDKIRKQTEILKLMIATSNHIDAKSIWVVDDSLKEMTLEESFEVRFRTFGSKEIEKYAQEIRRAFQERRLEQASSAGVESSAGVILKSSKTLKANSTNMMRAITTGDVKAVQEMMESLDINQQFNDVTYLGFAIRDNKIEIAQLILSHPEIEIDKSKIFEDLKFCDDKTFNTLTAHPKLHKQAEIAKTDLCRLAQRILKKEEGGKIIRQIEALARFSPSQDQENVKEFLQELIGKKFEFSNGTEKKKITILTCAAEAGKVDVVKYLLENTRVNPDEPCVMKERLESPLFKSIHLNSLIPSEQNAKILSLLIAYSKILDKSEGYEFVKQTCDETLRPLPAIVKQALSAREKSAIKQTKEEAPFNAKNFGADLVSEIISNIEGFLAFKNPELLQNIKENLDLLNFKHPFTEIINQGSIGLIIGAAIINPELKEIIASYDAEAVRLILSDQPFEDNAYNKKCLVNILNLCLQSKFHSESSQDKFVKIAIQKITTSLPKSHYEIDPLIADSLIHNAAQYEDPSLIKELVNKGLWNVNSTFKIKDGKSVNLLTMTASFGNRAAVEFLLSQKDIKLDKASITGTLKTCSKEIFEILTGNPKLNLTKAEIKYWRSYKLVAEDVNDSVSKITSGLPLTPARTDEIIKKLSALSSEEAKSEAINKIFILFRSEASASEENHTFLSLAIDMKCESRLIKFLLENGASLEQAKEQRGKDLFSIVIKRYKEFPNQNDFEILTVLIKATENLPDLQDAKKLFQKGKAISSKDKIIEKEFNKKESDLAPKAKEESAAAGKDLEDLLKEISGEGSSKKQKKPPEEIAKLREQQEANRLRNLAKAQERKAAKEAEEEKQKKLQEEKEQAKKAQAAKAQQEKEAAEERKRIAAEKAAAEKLAAAKAKAEEKLAAAKKAEAEAIKKAKIEKLALSTFEADKVAFNKRQDSFRAAGKPVEDITSFVKYKLEALRKIPEGNPLIGEQINLWQMEANPSPSLQPKGEASQLSAAAGLSRG